MFVLLLLVIVGALTGLAFPPYSLWPILFLAYPYFCSTLVKTTSKRQAFLRGLSFGFGHFLATLYWTPLGLMLPGIDLGFLVPPILVFLPLGLGLFFGFVGLIFKMLRPQQSSADVLTIMLFASCWSIGEVMRGHLFTGFPWNLAGTVFWDTPVFQTLSLWGIYGLSFITVLLMTFPLLSKRRFWIGILTPALLISGMWGWGYYRLETHPTTYHENVYIRLVQACIDQGQKWNPDLAAEHLDAHAALSMQESKKPLTHIVWAETTVPYLLNKDQWVRDKLARMIPEGVYLMVGASRYEHPPHERLSNSLFVLDHKGDILSYYDKHHLIPFAEYIPFTEYIPYRKIFPITQNFFGPIDFTPGEGVRTLRLVGTPAFSPSICYELIFPGEVVNREDRPEWLLNVTNDGWFGFSSGPYQHFEIARMRAIEEGLPLIRSANTGISAIIDSYGRVTAQLDLGKKGVLDADLPQAGPSPFFTEGGSYLIYIFIFSVLLLSFLFWRRKKT